MNLVVMGHFDSSTVFFRLYLEFFSVLFLFFLTRKNVISYAILLK